MSEISIKAEELLHIGNFPVTNALLMSLLVFIFLASASILLRKKLSLIPGKVQSVLELLLEGILNLMDSVLGSRAKSEKYLPFIATIFLFILFSNWFGLLPGVGSLVLREGEHGAIPVLRAPSSDLNFTLALAVLAVVSINIFGILAIGIAAHAKKFFDFSNPINFFLGILELISEFAKMVSFSFRLFGNIFAGEVLLTIIAFLVPYVIPLPFLFLEVFVGFIQAFVFGMLALVFTAIATTEHATEH
ncbi:MAG: F0F1 ATP synthase subunit A [Patescibacteria group bacterium]